MKIMEQQQLIKTIKVHIAKGDKAAEKSEQHYIAAGQHLKTLKAQHDDAGGKWADWETFLKEKIGIGKSRASDLMQIADGRKDVEQVRERAAEGMRKIRAQVSPSRDGENADEPKATKPIPPQVRRELEASKAHAEELEAARDYDQDVAEQLRAAEIKIVGLESEIEELKAENARLRAELEAEKQVEAVVPKRGRGRPPGSPNKPKPTTTETVVTITTPVENAPSPETEVTGTVTAPTEVVPSVEAPVDDGLDIPDWMRRTPNAAIIEGDRGSQ